MAIEFEFKGKKYEYNGVYAVPTQGDFYLSKTFARIIKAQVPPREARAIMIPVTVKHTLGGIVFEEIDSNRRAEPGEWYLHCDHIQLCTTAQTVWLYKILRPVPHE